MISDVRIADRWNALEQPGAEVALAGVREYYHDGFPLGSLVFRYLRRGVHGGAGRDAAEYALFPDQPPGHKAGLLVADRRHGVEKVPLKYFRNEIGAYPLYPVGPGLAPAQQRRGRGFHAHDLQPRAALLEGARYARCGSCG